jgi:hypothetical protein
MNFPPQMFNFEFMKAGERDPMQTASGLMRDLNQAKDHCKDLYEGTGRAMGASSVRVRENGGPGLVMHTGL